MSIDRSDNVLPNFMRDTGALAWPAASEDVASSLRPIWRRAFGRKGQDATGHILRMSVGIGRITRFLQDVRTELGVQIPPSALMQLGTIAALADSIGRNQWPAYSSRLRLRPGTSDTTLYVVAGGSGMILELCELVSQIEFRGEIWALQLPGLDGEAQPFTSIAEIATHHVNTIIDHHPGGPIHLIGYSLGGITCFEMARMLRARGHAVGFVGLIDSAYYEKYWPRAEWLRVSYRRARRRIAELGQMPPQDAASQMVARIVSLAKHVRRRFDPISDHDSITRSVYYVGGLEPNLQQVRDASIVAYQSYRPLPVDCHITLFVSRQGFQRGCNLEQIWRNLATRVAFVSIPGTHLTILRTPCSKELAGQISSRIASRAD